MKAGRGMAMVVAAVAAVAVALGMVAVPAGAATSAARRITVTATGEARGTPDVADVTIGVTARLRDLTKAGSVLDAAARVAGDEIRLQGITFAIDDDSGLLATARAKAVKRARAQAGQLADAAGVSLGDVVSIVEGNVVVPTESRSAADVTASSVPIEPGSQTASIQVTVVSRIA